MSQELELELELERERKRRLRHRAVGEDRNGALTDGAFPWHPETVPNRLERLFKRLEARSHCTFKLGNLTKQ